MLKKSISHASCEVEFDWYLRGSVLRGDVSSGAVACRTKLIVESPEDDETVMNIIALAKRGCFAEQMIQTAVPLTGTCVLNGREMALEGDAPQ